MSDNLHPTRQQLYDAAPDFAKASGAPDTGGLTDELRQQLMDADLAHMVAARDDAAAFCSYVIIDEELGIPIALAPMHREWHSLGDRYDHLIILAALRSGKTQQLSIGRTVWKLGKNPNRRIVVLSASDKLAMSITGTIRRYLDSSQEVKRVFPKLKLDKRSSCTNHELTVERPITTIKDPSLQARGVFNRVQGRRIDDLVIDDILTWENTHTKEQRDKVTDWVTQSLLIRIRGGSVTAVGNTWDVDDSLHRWSRLKGWFSVRYPAVGLDGKSTWPQGWPEHYIQKQREMHPLEFDRLMQCIPRSDMDSEWCRPDWIDHCLRRGLGRASVRQGQVRFTYSIDHVPFGFGTFTGVDFGVKQGAKNDLTSICTILEHPNGSLELLNIEAGRWTAPDIVQRLINAHQRYHSTLMLEDVGAQDFIRQFTNSLINIPMVNYKTDAKIRDPSFGIPTLFTEMWNGKWIFPCTGDLRTNPEFDELRKEMLQWQPTQHTGDRLMSLFLARECARQCKPVPGLVTKINIRNR